MSKTINQIGMPRCGLSEIKGRIRLFLHEIQTKPAIVDYVINGQVQMPVYVIFTVLVVR